jgi:hypothetical protein
MPAPKGNKNALGNSGRPRKHDLKQLAIDLEEWAKKEDSTNLCGFAYEKFMPAITLYEYAAADVEFRYVYNAVKNIIAIRREKLVSLGKLDRAAFGLSIRVYDHHVKADQQEHEKYLSDLKKDENNRDDEKILEGQQKVLSKLDELQTSSKSSCTNASNKSTNDK